MATWLEKIVFALIPLLISGIIYLFSNVIALQTDVQVLKANAMVMKLQLKIDMDSEIAQNRERITTLEAEVKQLQNQSNSHK